MRNPTMRGAVNDSAAGRDDVREPRVQLENLLLGLQMTALEMARQPNPLESVDVLTVRLSGLYRRALELSERLAAERAAMAGQNAPMILTDMRRP